jgi:putative transposon-encoded protein
MSNSLEQIIYISCICNIVVPSRKAKRKIEEIETTASESGTGAHVFVPKEWRGKKVRVTLID